MRLYLVQHGNAVASEVDPERPLSDRGQQDVEKIAGFIKPLTLNIDYIWHSEKKRAAQTAEIIAASIPPQKACIQRQGLAPNDDVTALKNELASANQDIMIVGHLPFLSKLASLLLAGSESANTVAFKQGGIVCLSRSEQGQWQIDWMVTPELLV